MSKPSDFFNNSYLNELSFFTVAHTECTVVQISNPTHLTPALNSHRLCYGY